MEPERLQERNYRESDFAEEKKLLKLMRELPDDTKKLISDAIKSDSAPISCKDASKKKGKKGSFFLTRVVEFIWGGGEIAALNDLPPTL